MKARAVLIALAAVIVLLSLPVSGANFTNASSNDANPFASGVLAPPTGVTADCGATITIDWTPTVDTYATGHRVLRSSNPGGPHSQIAEVTPRTTGTYDDTPASGIYYYVVSAYYLGWTSEDSNEVLASTGTCAAPVVDGLSPSSGVFGGGTVVVISGSGFTGATAVDFGGTPATGFDVDSDVQITATAPAGALGSVDVVVTTPLGSSADTPADDYTYIGDTYYVRTDGSDANDGLSNSGAGAWLTIQKAADTMVAGDMVRVQSGSYAETVTPLNAGTAPGPITYLAEGSVVIDGGNARCKAVDVAGADYLVIDGFEITDQPDCGGADSAIYINNADNVTVRNNIIHDTGRDAVYFAGTSSNGLVENNLVYNIDDDGSTPIGAGNHVYRNNTFAGTMGGSVLEGGVGSNLFEDNIFWAGVIDNTGLGTFNYNDYNAAVLPGTGNFSTDPLFVNPAGNDFHLSHIAAGQGLDSPAIDAGSDTAVNLGRDTGTTRTDAITDTGTVDTGYHYPG